MKTKNIPNYGVVIYGQQYGSTHLPGESGGLCYTGGLIRQAGIDPVQGVAYRVTVEPIGAELGAQPEPWMYEANYARQKDVTRARQTLRKKTSIPAARDHARQVIARFNEGKRTYRAHLKFYFRWLGVRQFKKK